MKTELRAQGEREAGAEGEREAWAQERARGKEREERVRVWAARAREGVQAGREAQEQLREAVRHGMDDIMALLRQVPNLLRLHSGCALRRFEAG